MITVQTRARVDEARRVTVQLPPDVAPGEYDVVVVAAGVAPEGGDGSAGQAPRAEAAPAAFPVDDPGPWPAGLSLRREDLYGDDGR